MRYWTKVVVYPLGLAGFALFVLYLISNKQQLPQWLIPTAVMAALLGGLLLAFWDRSTKKESGRRSERKHAESQPPDVKQASLGDQSPNIADALDVNINYGQPVQRQRREKRDK